MREFEKKILLSCEEYDYLMKHFGYESPLKKKPVIKQINYYFDTDDLSMNRQNITCRIRLKNGRYQGTMKQHSLDSEHSTETEVAVYDGIHKNGFTEMGLTLQGALVTERCVIFKDEKCEAVLDKNEYLGHIDYELEIEYIPEYEKDALTLLKIFQGMLIRRKCFIAYKESRTSSPSVHSKSRRFFERRADTKQENKKSSSNNEDTETFEYSDPDGYLSDYFYS